MKILTITVITVLVLALGGSVAWAVINMNNLDDTRTELASTNSQLEETFSELNRTEGELASTRTTLANTEDELTQTKGDLEDVSGELAAVETELADTSARLSATNLELADTKRELSDTQQELTSAKSDLSAAEARLDTFEERLAAIEEELALANEVLDGLGIELEATLDNYDADLIDNPAATNPTFQELKAFLAQDATENHSYVINVYDCSEFSRDVHNNAEAAGIRAAVVHVLFAGESYGHALNAFLTTDYGLVYVDCTASPDKIARVVVGKRLYAIELSYINQSNIRNNQWWDGLLYTVGHYYYVTNSPVSDITFFW